MLGCDSWSLAATIAPVKSFATRRPTIPALMMFSRTRAKPASVGSKSTGSTLPGHDAVLDHLDEADVRREDRVHLRPIHARQKEHCVGHLTQRGEEPGREHVVIAGHHRDQHAIRAAELLAILEEGLHVFVLDWHQLGEAGIDPQPCRQPPHRQGDEHERCQHETASVEQQIFDPR